MRELDGRRESEIEEREAKEGGMKKLQLELGLHLGSRCIYSHRRNRVVRDLVGEEESKGKVKTARLNEQIWFIEGGQAGKVCDVSSTLTLGYRCTLKLNCEYDLS